MKHTKQLFITSLMLIGIGSIQLPVSSNTKELTTKALKETTEALAANVELLSKLQEEQAPTAGAPTLGKEGREILDNAQTTIIDLFKSTELTLLATVQERILEAQKALDIVAQSIAKISVIPTPMPPVTLQPQPIETLTPMPPQVTPKAKAPIIPKEVEFPEEEMPLEEEEEEPSEPIVFPKPAEEITILQEISEPKPPMPTEPISKPTPTPPTEAIEVPSQEMNPTPPPSLPTQEMTPAVSEEEKESDEMSEEELLRQLSPEELQQLKELGLFDAEEDEVPEQAESLEEEGEPTTPQEGTMQPETEAEEPIASESEL